MTIEEADARIAHVQQRYNVFAQIGNPAAPGLQGSGPLAGIDVSVKDILDVGGMPTRWGSKLLEETPPAASDAAAVVRLRAAGARIVAKTTTTEFAHSPLGDSPLTGRTLNPWNPAFTCGGSSSGAGVAVATGATPLSLATDAGCSTRLPASLAGVWGLKPTLGRMPHERLPEGFATIVHLGIVAASVDLLTRGLAAMAGPDANDPMSLGHPPFAAQPGSPGLQDSRVLLWRTAGNEAIDEEVHALLDDVAADVTRLGATVVEADYPLANPQDCWAVLQQVGWGGRFGGLSEAERARLSPSMLAGIDAGLAISGRQLNAALIQRTGYFRSIQAVLADVDFILTPCASAPALPVDHAIDAPLLIGGREMGEIRRAWLPYLSLFDLSGHPALAMPAGRDSNGVPMGVQLVGRWGGEARLLAAAAQWEATRNWPSFADCRAGD